jgi:small-conductance mechanosensitive channel
MNHERSRQPYSWRLLPLLVLCLSGALSAQDVPAAGPAASTPAATVHKAPAGESGAEPAPADLVVANRVVATLRSNWLGFPPADRVRDAERKIDTMLERGVIKPVTAEPFAEGYRILIAKKGVFNLLASDRDPFSEETLDQAKDRVVRDLAAAMQASWESKRPAVILRGVGMVLLVTILIGLLLWLCFWLLRKLVERMASLAPSKLSQMNEDLAGFFASPLRAVANWILRLGLVGVIVFLGYVWLTFSLRQFPLTRPWGNALRGFFFDMAGRLAGGMLAALPGLCFVVVIFFITRAAIRLLRLFFLAVEEGRLAIPGVHPDTAPVTRRIVTSVLWIFALVMAYPYLPGSDSMAFKGVGVFLGLLISIGSSGVVSQAASGIILVYSRAFRPGDFVQIGETEGTVLSIGLLSTKIRTNKREQINIPNSVLTSSTTKNYSSLVEEQGVIVHTSVTIGYDAPWRQIHAMLLLAADRTPELRKEPKPFVFQAALSDFYVEYQLYAYLGEPSHRPRVLAELHAHIQDVFNEHGVQIMSPHYESDPEGAKLVPPAKWYPAPAAGPETKEGA